MKIFKRVTPFILVIAAAITLAGCADSLYKTDGQVRNNQIWISKKTALSRYWSDPVFESFGSSGATYADYEKSLLDQAQAKGINAYKLKKAIDTVRRLKSEKIQVYPVVIETARINYTDNFIIVCTWEYKSSLSDDIVKPLGHIMVAVIDANSLHVAGSNTCR